MATYRAISTGVASALARWEVWDGAAWVAATVLPTVADDVYANNFTVTLDVNFSTSSVQTRSNVLGVTAGGGFTLNAGITLLGDVYVGQTVADSGAVTPAAGDSVIIGNIYNGASGVNIHGVRKSTAGKITIVGSLICTSSHGTTSVASSNTCVKISGSAQADVSGNATTSAGTNAFPQYAARNDTGLNFNFVLRGRANGTQFTSNLGAFKCEVNELQGFNQDCTVYGLFVMPNTNQTTWTNCKAKTGANVQIEIYDEANQPVLCNPLYAQDQADPADVRSATVYANGALTGTCAVPPAASVSLGVPVDATTGTASVDASELRDLILPSILSAITAP